MYLVLIVFPFEIAKSADVTVVRFVYVININTLIYFPLVFPFCFLFTVWPRFVKFWLYLLFFSWHFKRNWRTRVRPPTTSNPSKLSSQILTIVWFCSLMDSTLDLTTPSVSDASVCLTWFTEMLINLSFLMLLLAGMLINHIILYEFTHGNANWFHHSQEP